MQIKAFIKKLGEREHSKSLPEKFRDFVELAYCAYAKPMADTAQADALEARYMQIVATYRDKDAVRGYPELIVLVAEGIQTGDFLGCVAAELGALNSGQGQFFTPYEISRMMAEMLIGEKEAVIEEQGYLIVQEPAVGSAGMVLALAHTMQRRGYDPTSQLFVSAIDISAHCYWMAYLQLTLAGIPAQVVRGNSLSSEIFESAWTAAVVPFLGRHGNIFDEPEQAVTVESERISQARQLTLF
jgi:hypothetical protein